MFLTAADAGADDVQEEEDTFSIYTPREALSTVSRALTQAGYQIEESQLIWVPKNEVEVEKDQAIQIMNFVEKLEELDDVDSVASNLHLTDEVAAALEAA